MTKQKQDKITLEIIQELGLEKLPEKRQNNILAKIGELILKKIFVETIDKLNDKDRRDFEKMLEKGETADNIEKFLNEKIEDYDRMVEKIVIKLKKEIKETM